MTRYEITWKTDDIECGSYGTPEELASTLAEHHYEGLPIALRGDAGEVIGHVANGAWVPVDGWSACP